MSSHSVPLHDSSNPAVTNQAPRVGSIWNAFTVAARAHPDAIAIVGAGGDLTYRQLRAHADAVGDRLAEEGIGPGDRIALLCQRDALVPAAMLGILSVGAVFVPIETDAPPARRTQVLELAACRAVISNLPSAERPADTLDLTATCITTRPRSTPIHHATPDDPASVMFTSGSTGQPKGVLIPHRAIVRLASAGILELGPGCRFLHASSLAFDASTLELWGPLLNGGTVVTLEAKPDVKLLERVIRDQRVTAAWLTAALFHLCADTNPTMFAPLTTLLTGGDVVSPRHAAAVLAANPRLRLINGYGPTENTTFTTTYDIANPDPTTPLPIGRPIAGTGVVITDEQLQPVPSGEVGELIATGQGLALGYLHDPDLTAARFVTLPHSGEPGYRTGDLARVNSNGLIEFLGRNDDQVKINGFRVEPGEIEAVLRAQPFVREAAVVMANENGETRPHAFVTLEPIESWPEHRALIRRRLSRVLPPYALPVSFTLQTTLPVTASGKADRRALRTLIEHGEFITELSALQADSVLQIAAQHLDRYWNPYQQSSDQSVAHHHPHQTGSAGPFVLRAPCGSPATLLLVGNSVRLKLPPGTSQRIRQWRCSDAAAIIRGTSGTVNATPDLACVMGDDERDIVRYFCTQGSIPYSSTSLWTELVNSSRARADQPAIVSESTTLTFGELLQACEDAAKQLDQANVTPGECIALMDRRCPESVVWLFAILSRDCTCVPLTPEMPQQRVESITRLSNATRLIDPAHGVLSEPQAFKTALRHNRSNPAPNAAPNLVPGRDAMILFTSGTTAEPKGIRIRHDSILNTIAWFSDLLPLTERDTVTQRSWFSWDCSILETMWPLFSGAAIAVIDPSKTRDPGSFARSARDLGATVLVTVPSIVSRIGSELSNTRDNAIRVVICAGEKLTATTAHETIRSTGAALYNVYGPSETSVITNCWKAPQEFDEVPVGKPGRNVGIRIESNDGVLCPVGTTGEIVIQGIQVSDGYINQPDQDQSHFAGSTNAATASYRTGDLGYWREDGNICFVSRRDAQIKIFGYRIEPEEIESVLSRVPGVRDVAVATHGEGADRTLVALCVQEPDYPTPLSSAVISRHLRGQLEPHALPARFIWTPSIPRFSSGKIDRRAVATHTQSFFHDQPSPTPTTAGADISTQVRHVWAMLIGHPPVSDDADFIQSGGNSLLLLRLLMLLEKTIGVELPILPGLQGQSPASIAAAFIAQHEIQTPEDFGAEIRANSSGHLRKLTDGPEMILALPHLGGTLGYLSEVAKLVDTKAAIYGIRQAGLIAGETPLGSVHEMVDGYTQLVLGQGWKRIKLIGFSSGATIAVDLARSLVRSGVKVEHLYLADGIPCHRPAPGPRLRSLYAKIMWRIPKRFTPLTAPNTRPYDLSGYQDEQLALARATLAALFRHKPARYNGASTIIRTSGSVELTSPASWGRVLNGSVTDVILEGAGHSSMWLPPHHANIARIILSSVAHPPDHSPADMHGSGRISTV